MCSPCIAMHDYWSVHVGQAVYASLDAAHACPMYFIFLTLPLAPPFTSLIDVKGPHPSFACVSFLSMHLTVTLI